MWQPGTMLNKGRFQITRLLGAGGFGVTYQAMDVKAEKFVAIKTLNDARLNGPDADTLKDRFFNEGIALANARHPYVVRVLPQCFTEQGRWCLVMEYVEGQNLAEYLEEKGVLAEGRALDLIQKVGSALSHLHQLDPPMLHRDIKPENILLRKSGVDEPVLIDFGLAREYEAGELRSMTSVGTPPYMPIEQLERRGNFGPSLDVYALAGTLYTLVTAQLPLPSKFRRLNIPLPLPKDLNPALSDRFNDAILMGMAMEAKDRPQSVAAWLELLVPSKPLFQSETVEVNEKGVIIQRRSIQVEGYIDDLGNGVQLEMIKIPGGRFLMGQTEAEKVELIREVGEENYARWYARELPQHPVSLSEFYMGRYAITQEQYEAVMGRNPACFKGARRPVEEVSWNGAQEFCQKLSQLTGRDYRLPSEAQWEYACRAGTTTPFHFGPTLTPEIANYDGDYSYGSGPKGKSRGKTMEVGSFPSNGYGLYDMHGNVLEWCEDRYHDTYQGAPSDGSAWITGGNQEYRLLRGGSWYNPPSYCRSAFRHFRPAGGRIIPYVGLRVVCVSARTLP